MDYQLGRYPSLYLHHQDRLLQQAKVCLASVARQKPPKVQRPPLRRPSPIPCEVDTSSPYPIRRDIVNSKDLVPVRGPSNLYNIVRVLNPEISNRLVARKRYRKPRSEVHSPRFLQLIVHNVRIREILDVSENREFLVSPDDLDIRASYSWDAVDD